MSINRNSKLWVLDIGIFCFNFMIFVPFLEISIPGNFHWGKAKQIKASPCVNCNEDKYAKKHETLCPDKDESCKRILNKLKASLVIEDVKLLEELFVLEGILFDPYSVEELESSYEDVTLWTMSSLQQAVEELVSTVEELKMENYALKARIVAAERLDVLHKESCKCSIVLHKILSAFSFFNGWGQSLLSGG